MVPAKLIKPLRHATVVALAATFPLLYVGAVSLESAVVTVIALVVAGIAGLLAALAF
jgi:hypothetical protein